MADAPSGDIRAEILAELSAEAKPDAPVVEEAPAEAVEEAAAQDAAVEDVEVEAGPEDDAPDVEDEPVDDDEIELKSDDPKEQKLLDNVRRAEKRMREAAQRRDAEFGERQREWQAKIDRVAEIDKLLARAKYDPVALFRAANVSPEDFEIIAQTIYAESPALQNDPKQKAAAQARLRERERTDEIAELKKKQADIEAKLEQSKRDAVVQAEAAAYIQQINAAAATKHPLVAALLKADPDDTNDALVATYNALGKKLNRAPKAIEVVAAYDKAQRARLTKLGIDPDAIAKSKPAPVATKPANGNAPAAKQAAPAAKPNGAKKLTAEEERAAILAELERERAAAKSAAQN